MQKTKDGLIEIYQGKSPSDIIFQPAAWSVVNLPVVESEATAIQNSLFHSATSRHVMLLLCRHKRKDRPVAIRNMPLTNWQYFDTVSIAYEKASTCSNNGLLPLSETGWIFYKGDTPDAKKTEWFSDGEHNNATNFWWVAPNVSDTQDYIYYQKFNAETQLLLMSLASPIEHKRFIYTFPLDKKEQVDLFSFCHKYGIVAAIYAKTHEEVEEILGNYNRFLEKR